MLRIALPSLLLALVLAAIGGASVTAHEAWLAPSLGSAAFSQLLHPEEPSAKPYAIAIGQIAGAFAGFVAVAVTGQSHTPPFLGDHGLTTGRLAAIALAVLLASILQNATGAKTPAGGATALVVALGLETASFVGAFRLAIGICLVTGLGEIARRFLMWTRRPTAALE